MPPPASVPDGGPAAPRGRTPMVLPGAMSPLTADLVRGPRRTAVVLATARYGAYLGAGERVLPVLAADALALPGAVRLAVPSSALDLGARPGQVVVVGAGALRFPRAVVRGTRTWRPARVHPSGRAGADLRAVGRVLSAALEAHGPAPAWLTTGVSAAVATAGAVAAREHDVRRAVAALVGRGPGLTPSGDDALAGALLLRRGLGLAPRPGTPDLLVAAVRDRARSTTAVSASLLLASCEGWATDEAVDLVGAVAHGDPIEVARALPAVLAVGHTSGRDLVAGVASALAAFVRARSAAA